MYGCHANVEAEEMERTKIGIGIGDAGCGGTVFVPTFHLLASRAITLLFFRHFKNIVKVRT